MAGISYLEYVRTAGTDRAAGSAVTSMVDVTLAVLIVGDDLFPVVSDVVESVIGVEYAAVALRLQAVYRHPRVCALQPNKPSIYTNLTKKMSQKL